MSNPFSGLINDAFKQQFKDAISAVVEGCELPCRLTYATTKYEDCTACVESNPGSRGPNPFLPNGNPHTGSCAKCQGSKRIPVPNEEVVNLIVLWNYDKYTSIATALKAPDGDVQTFCSIDLITKIKDADFIVFNTNIEATARHKFTRAGEPEPCGLGEDAFILTPWKKV